MIQFPATSPYVLAVGGTTLHARANAKKQVQITEVVWNDGPGSGTGGGVSHVTPVPAWQQGIVPNSINPKHFAGRAIPDVAANADLATGYLTMSGGKLGVVGGTSASAPLWASLIARINAALGARSGNFNALLYSKFGPASVLRDITVGNNDTDGLLGGQDKAGPRREAWRHRARPSRCRRPIPQRRSQPTRLTQQLGFELAANEMAPQLRIQYFDQSIGEFSSSEWLRSRHGRRADYSECGKRRGRTDPDRPGWSSRSGYTHYISFHFHPIHRPAAGTEPVGSVAAFLPR